MNLIKIIILPVIQFQYAVNLSNNLIKWIQLLLCLQGPDFWSLLLNSNKRLPKWPWEPKTLWTLKDYVEHSNQHNKIKPHHPNQRILFNKHLFPNKICLRKVPESKLFYSGSSKSKPKPKETTRFKNIALNHKTYKNKDNLIIKSNYTNNQALINVKIIVKSKMRLKLKHRLKKIWFNINIQKTLMLDCLIQWQRLRWKCIPFNNRLTTRNKFHWTSALHQRYRKRLIRLSRSNLKFMNMDKYLLDKLHNNKKLFQNRIQLMKINSLEGVVCLVHSVKTKFKGNRLNRSNRLVSNMVRIDLRNNKYLCRDRLNNRDLKFSSNRELLCNHHIRFHQLKCNNFKIRYLSKYRCLNICKCLNKCHLT
jgi:hypothetical protein